MNKNDNIDKNDKNNEIESTQQQHQEEDSIILDLKATFAARDAQSKLNSIWAVITFRIIAVLFSVTVIIDGVLKFHEENIELSFVMFLTNWSLILTLLFYHVPVLVFSFKPNLTLKTGEIESTEQNLEPSFLSKITWGSYSVAAVSQILSASFFWMFQLTEGSTPNKQFYDWASHGLVCSFLLIDGIFITVIPVRFKHIIFVYVFHITYVLWLLLHTFLQIGINSDKDDDTLLYDALNFREGPIVATALVLFICFIAIPTFFFLIYISSIASIKKRTLDGSCRKWQTVRSNLALPSETFNV